MGRFVVVEYSSFFAVRDTHTGQERPMSDGVDALFTPTGKSMRPGSEYFRKTWQRVLNEDEDETLRAYFPELYWRENTPSTPGHEPCPGCVNCGRGTSDR